MQLRVGVLILDVEVGRLKNIRYENKLCDSGEGDSESLLCCTNFDDLRYIFRETAEIFWCTEDRKLGFHFLICLRILEKKTIFNPYIYSDFSSIL